MENRTKKIEVRLTPQEHSHLKEVSGNYSSMSHYVKEALREYSGVSPRERIEAQRELSQLYAKIEIHLAHIGGNLNQAMRQCNETAKAGLPVTTLLRNKVMPVVEQCNATLVDVRKELSSITTKFAK